MPLVWTVFIAIATGIIANVIYESSKHKLKDIWAKRSLASARKRAKHLHSRLELMELYRHDPVRVIAKAAMELLSGIVLSTLTVIYVLNDPTKAPEVHLLFTRAFYNAHERQISLAIVIGTDFLAFIACAFVLAKIRFFRNLVRFEIVKRDILREITSLQENSGISALLPAPVPNDAKD